MNQSRKMPRMRALVLGLPPALFMVILGSYLTLLAWGLLGAQGESTTLAIIGPLVGGFGIALVYVCVRPHR